MFTGLGKGKPNPYMSFSAMNQGLNLRKESMEGNLAHIRGRIEHLEDMGRDMEQAIDQVKEHADDGTSQDIITTLDSRNNINKKLVAFRVDPPRGSCASACE